jgi:hypothetical protein
MSSEIEHEELITRRDAILRVSALLGGMALVGGSALLTGCRDESKLARGEAFTADDVAFLDEVADTILPPTKTPGAKAARTGAFMALMVTDSYGARDQAIFRDGMRKLDDASRAANGAPFMTATPQQRLTLLEKLDREQKAVSDAREAAQKAKARKRIETPGATPAAVPAQAPETRKSDAHLPDERKENAVGSEASGAAAVTADTPAHYFRMMKELALLGYFTSEIGYTKAMRYVESPGRFDPCAPYTKGEPAWAPHA